VPDQSLSTIDKAPAKRIAIVGAGLTGLTAALRLQQLGHAVTVFEKNEQAGGRTMTVRKGGFAFDVGAITMLPTYDRVIALAKELGLSLNEISPVLVIPRGGRSHYLDFAAPVRSLLQTRLISGWAKLRLFRLAPYLRKAWPLSGFESLSPLAGMDRETVSDAVERLCGKEVNDCLAGPIIRGNTLNSTRNAPFGEFLWMLRQYAAGKLYGFDGGINALAEAIASRLPINFNSEVTAVTWDGVNVRIEGSHNGPFTELFDAAFIAQPPASMLQLAPNLSSRQRKILEQIEPLKSISLHVGLRKKPANFETFILPLEQEEADLTTIVFDHNKAPGRAPEGKGVLSFFMSEDWATRNFDISDEDIVMVILAKAAPFVGHIGEDIEEYHVQRWPYAILKSEIGIYSTFAEYEAEPVLKGPIQLGGDFICMGSMETAVRIGEIGASGIASYFEGPVSTSSEDHSTIAENG
jgi:protoporphyrinogen/coproporphyrinogen III oxidase